MTRKGFGISQKMMDAKTNPVLTFNWARERVDLEKSSFTICRSPAYGSLIESAKISRTDDKTSSLPSDVGAQLMRAFRRTCSSQSSSPRTFEASF